MKTKLQLENLTKLKEFWELVLPETVCPSLSKWYEESGPCGAVACLGGHMALSGIFEAQGVRVNPYSDAPYLSTRGFELDSLDLAELLFGERALFSKRSGRPGHSKVSDWQIAYNRILRALET